MSFGADGHRLPAYERGCRESGHRCPECRGVHGSNCCADGPIRRPGPTARQRRRRAARRVGAPPGSRAAATPVHRVGARTAPPAPGARRQAFSSGERGALPAGAGKQPPSAATPDRHRDLRTRRQAERKAQVGREQQGLPQPQQRETRAVAGHARVRRPSGRRQRSRPPWERAVPAPEWGHGCYASWASRPRSSPSRWL